MPGAPARPAQSARRADDRAILGLALPAFGALVAEPLYVLADTAIVAGLGRLPLASFGVAGAVLSATVGLFNFLAYTTTGRVARLLGAGDRRGAVRHGVDGLWLAAGIGLAVAALGLLAAGPAVRVMGASAAVAPGAALYLRVAAVGVPAALVALAGAGARRGLQDTTSTLVIAVGGNAANLALEVWFVYGLHWGLAGSAWATDVAQWLTATAFVAVMAWSARVDGAGLGPDRSGVRGAAVVGATLMVRTAALLAALTLTTAVAARLSDTALAAHTVAYQVFLFLALALDAIAIAGQALVGRALGSGDPAAARRLTRRMLVLGVGGGLLLGAALALLAPAVAAAIAPDPATRAQLVVALRGVAAIQPVAAVAFVLDGVLIGAGDQRFLAVAMVGAVVVYLPFVLAVVPLSLGLAGLWAAVGVLMVGRAVPLALRVRGSAWTAVALGTA